MQWILSLLFFLRRCVWWQLSIGGVGWATVVFSASGGRVSVCNARCSLEEVLTHGLCRLMHLMPLIEQDTARHSPCNRCRLEPGPGRVEWH